MDDRTFETASDFLFPTHVMRSDDPAYGSYRDDLIAACHAARQEDPAGVLKANVTGWQSRDDVFTLPPWRPWLARLQTQIDDCLQREIRPVQDIGFIVTNAWINIAGQHAHTVTHVHPNALLSGVFYVLVPPDSGNITFYDAKEFQAYRETQIKPPALRRQHRLDLNAEYPAQEGRMLLFPSWLAHDVGVNRSTQDRISISFNLIDFPGRMKRGRAG